MIASSNAPAGAFVASFVVGGVDAGCNSAVPPDEQATDPARSVMTMASFFIKRFWASSCLGGAFYRSVYFPAPYPRGNGMVHYIAFRLLHTVVIR